MHNYTAERMSQLLALVPTVLYTCRADDDFAATFISENVTTLLGYSVEEYLENPNFWKENLHPDDRDRILAEYPSFYSLERYTHEYRFRKKDGEFIWLHDELRLSRDQDGAPLEIVGSFLDITERKEVEFSLRKSEALFRDFFQTNPVATIISTPEGEIRMVNPAFSDRSGYTAEEVVGCNSTELGFWKSPADRERMVSGIRQHGFVDNIEGVFYGKNEQPITCLVSSRAIEFSGELMILSTVNDVTEQRKADAALRELDEAKNAFLSIAAHELRTPLVAVIGYAELLENVENLPMNDEQRRDYVSIIKSNAEMLNCLVDDLLDVGRIQLGRSFSLSLAEHDLAALISDVVESVRLKSNSHELVISYDNPLPATISLDRSRIAQVLTNLINNAIKFSPQGGSVTIQTQTGEGAVSISVSDQGIGMTYDQLEHIFDRFYRVENDLSETQGLGLGMCIVKQIVTDHGGRITVNSNSGEGTTVTFSLPRQ